VLTQIYEVSTAEQARAISAIGVDHIGILVGDGEFPRELPIHVAKAVAAAVLPGSKWSALFLTARLGLIETWSRELRPDIVHLGAAPDLLCPQALLMLKPMLRGMPIMRSVPVTGPESIEIARGYDGIADFLLLDSHRESDRQIGALGVTHDWNVSRQIVQRLRTPVILAGGLGPDNAAEAIGSVRPAGVDSKTKTDLDGSHVKDLERVRRFHQLAKAAA
jgi:phosphoribosylanthranilate isomerase